MQLIIVTAPDPLLSEVDTITGLFEAGLKLLHLRKPGYSEEQLAQLIEAIPSRFHRGLMLHSHHQLVDRYGLGGRHYPAARRDQFDNHEGLRSTSCHSPEEVEQWATQFTYLLLSPVFDSISKPGYRGAFSPETLARLCQRHRNLVALGGIDPCTLGTLAGQGWYGAAALGAVWNQPNPAQRLHSYSLLRKLATRCG